MTATNYIPDRLADGHYFWRSRNGYHWSLAYVFDNLVSAEFLATQDAETPKQIGGQWSRKYEPTEAEVADAMTHQTHQARNFLKAIVPCWVAENPSNQKGRDVKDDENKRALADLIEHSEFMVRYSHKKARGAAELGYMDLARKSIAEAEKHSRNLRFLQTIELT